MLAWSTHGVEGHLKCVGTNLESIWGSEDFDVMVCLGIRRSDVIDCLQTGVLDLVSKALEMFWVVSIAEGMHQPLQCSK